jgi:hypothetical protein
MNRPRSVHLISGFGVLLILVAFALLLLVRSGDGTEGGSRSSGDPSITVEPYAFAATASPAESDMVVEVEAAPLPDDPDSFLRRGVEALSSHPQIAAWLVTDRLADRFVLAVDAVAGGYSPREQLAEFAPAGRFHVESVATDRLEVTHASYARYDVFAEAFASVDAAGAARFLAEIESLCEERYQALTWVRGTFRDTLIEAMDHLLVTPRLTVSPEVVPGVLTYHFADAELEELSDAQRHLLRMGPRNAARVLQTLEAIRIAYAGPMPEVEDQVAAPVVAVMAASEPIPAFDLPVATEPTPLVLPMLP